MANTLTEAQQLLIWNWTWKRLKADRLQDVEDRFGKKFTDWAISERNKLTDAQGESEDIPIYTGSLALILDNISEIVSYVHDQGTPASVWNITHPLNMKPSVMTVDTADVSMEGQIEYIDDNNLTITFNGAFSGKAYLS